MNSDACMDHHQFSQRYRFGDWPNPAVPPVAAGAYAIWNGSTLIYCGMSGRSYEDGVAAGRLRLGLATRLASHASGRLSGDQFCVYVANRLVIPSLEPVQLQQFASGALTLDRLTRDYIRQRLEYQFAVVSRSELAYELERRCREGTVFGSRPLLNPAEADSGARESTARLSSKRVRGSHATDPLTPVADGSLP